MTDGYPEVVRLTTDGQRAEGWSFVLEAVAIPHEVAPLEGGWAIVVEPKLVARAREALDAHDREQAEAAQPDPAVPDHGPSWAAVLVPVALLAFFVVTGARDAGDPGGWFADGSAVAAKIVRGEWWRAVTALTLHADAAHVAGNAVALVVFGAALCRWLGSGVALALVLLAGVTGNLITAYTYGAGHNSVGASTAAFGALGLLGGLQAVRRFRVRTRIDRKRWALAAVAACLGLFAMLGVGERADVIAHVAGMGSGLALGLGMGLAVKRPVPRWAQWALRAAALAIVVGCWVIARR